MISVKNLEKRYGSLVAVKNVSFEVSQGEIVGLLGHNGAGKTTVMKIITGYLEPTAGTVTVGNIDVIADRLGVQKQIGYMPENAPLYDEMLVQEYLLMMADLKGIPKEKQMAAVAEAIKATGVEKLLTRPIATLSKGFRQRVALCQAIVHKPEVLILDEPTNGLDPVQIVEIRTLIKKLSKNSTVFLSTHILPEIEAVCDRVIILIDGELSKDAKLSTLLKSNQIRISLSKEAANVEKELKNVKGVASVADKGPDLSRAGFELWSIECEPDTAPAPEIVRAAIKAQWEIASVAQERSSLEQVFGALMDEHVNRKRGASVQEVSA
jgi:ABC-2 type transport system ATP-binding protein